MALQDDIFDIEDALAGKPEQKAFKELVVRLGAYEREVQVMQAREEAIRKGYAALKIVLGGV